MSLCLQNLVSLVNVVAVIGTVPPGTLAILQTSLQKQLSFGGLGICGGKKSMSCEGDCMVSIPQACRGSGLKVDLLLVRLGLGIFTCLYVPFFDSLSVHCCGLVSNFSLGNFFTVLFLT